ncbi:MAG: hypothetical protein SOZ56_11260 [Oscillospiraceae bacterium]|nr:hypothetical protein [Oscillospiraceae bacterium]
MTVDGAPGGGESGNSGGSSGGATTAEPITVGNVTLSNGMNVGDGVVGVTGAKQNSYGSVTITATEKNGYNSGSFTISKDDSGNVVYTFTVDQNWWFFSNEMGEGWKNEGDSFVLDDTQIAYLQNTYGITLN